MQISFQHLCELLYFPLVFSEVKGTESKNQQILNFSKITVFLLLSYYKSCVYEMCFNIYIGYKLYFRTIPICTIKVYNKMLYVK